MRTPPPDNLRFSNTTAILPKKTMWFIGVEVEQETSAPPPKKNPGSAPVTQKCTMTVGRIWSSVLMFKPINSIQMSDSYMEPTPFTYPLYNLFCTLLKRYKCTVFRI